MNAMKQDAPERDEIEALLPWHAALENLFAKIDAEPERQPAPSLNLGSRIGEFLASLSPRTLAWSATAAALAIVLQAGFLADIMLKETKTTGYETASAPSTDPGVGEIGCG